jgi:hypothetical protein
MNYTPQSQDEVQKLALKSEPLKRGIYDGVITAAIVKLTRETDKEMLEITIDIRGRSIKDWFVGESKIGSARLRNLAEAVGKLDRYETGELNQSDLPGLRVQVVLGVKRANKNFPARNFVEEYKPSTNSGVQLSAG